MATIDRANSAAEALALPTAAHAEILDVCGIAVSSQCAYGYPTGRIEGKYRRSHTKRVRATHRAADAKQPGKYFARRSQIRHFDHVAWAAVLYDSHRPRDHA